MANKVPSPIQEPMRNKKSFFRRFLTCCQPTDDDESTPRDTQLTSIRSKTTQRPQLYTTASSQEKSINSDLYRSKLVSESEGEGHSRFTDGRWGPTDTSSVYGQSQRRSASGKNLKNKTSSKSLTELVVENEKNEDFQESHLITTVSSGPINPTLHSAPPSPPLGPSHALLGPPEQDFKDKKCLVLDLDETLVHSSFKYIPQADFVIPVEMENQYSNVYVIKRPGVDEFMKRVGQLYELVVFTASVAKYGDPLLDQLDVHRVIQHRLFRESCYNYNGNYIKNLSQLGRPLEDVIIIDNSPGSYILHPQHAVPISSWFSDVHDNELLDMIPFLEDLAGKSVQDVGLVLDMNL